MTILLNLAAILFYLAATLLMGQRLMEVDSQRGANSRAGLWMALCALVLHSAVLYQGVWTAEGPSLGFFNAASLVAWGIVLLLLLGTLVKPLANLGVLAFPLGAITLVLSLFYSNRSAAQAEMGYGVTLHVVLSVLAASLLGIAAFQSVSLAFQERRLRHKRPGGMLGFFPPLQVQESLLFHLIGLGFFLLSLSLVSGIAFLEDMFAQHLAHKTLLSLLAWMVFALLLWGRWRHGWRGRKAAHWSLVGFSMLMLAYFGSKLVLEVFLGRAWHVSVGVIPELFLVPV